MAKRKRAKARKAAGAVPAELRAASLAELVSFGEADALFRMIGGEAGTPEGVTLEQAMSLPPVAAAVGFLANAMASLPVRIYRRNGPGAADDVRVSHPAEALLNEAASDYETAFDARRAIHADQFGPGRGFAWIEKDSDGQPLNIWPLAHDRVTVRRTRTGRRWYDYTRESGAKVTYRGEDVLDLAFEREADRLASRSPVLRSAAAIRQGLNASRFALNTFGRNGVPPFALTGPLASADAARRAADDVARVSAEQADRGRPVLPLPAGFKLDRLGADPDKMQLTEVQKFVVVQVARIFQLPPVFLQDLTAGAFANTEQQDLFLVKHTLRPRVRQADQMMTLRLFGRGSEYVVRSDLDEIARGVLRDRVEAQARAIQSGQMTLNEARALNSLPPVEGGNSLFMQSGTVPIEALIRDITGGRDPAAGLPGDDPEDEDPDAGAPDEDGDGE